MTPYDYLKSLNEVCHFQTREGKLSGPVSNSEFRRWLKNQVLSINGFKIAEDEIIDYPIFRVTLFTKKKIITIM